MQDNKSQPIILAHSVKGQMRFCHVALSVRPQFAKIAIGTSINIVNSHQPGVITEGLSHLPLQGWLFLRS